MGKQLIISGADFSANAIEQVTTHAVTWSLTNVSGDSTPASVVDGQTVSVTLTAATGYTLPSSVSVKETNTNTPITTSVTYDQATGALSVANVTTDVTITVSGDDVVLPDLQYSYNDIDQSKIGIVKCADGEIDETNFQRWRHTDFLNCNGYTKYALLQYNNSGNNNSAAGLAWYDSGKHFISGASIQFSQNDNHVTVTGNVPAGAAYLRFCSWESGFLESQNYPSPVVNLTLTDE